MMRTYILFIVMMGLGVWLLLDQVEQKALAEQAVAQYKQSFNEAGLQIEKLKANKKADEQLIADLAKARQIREGQSRASQQKTKEELSSDENSNASLPSSISERLQNRIHRQAGKYSGISAG
jgi:hypothetical protein